MKSIKVKRQFFIRLLCECQPRLELEFARILRINPLGLGANFEQEQKSFKLKFQKKCVALSLGRAKFFDMKTYPICVGFDHTNIRIGIVGNFTCQQAFILRTQKSS